MTEQETILNLETISMLKALGNQSDNSDFLASILSVFSEQSEIVIEQMNEAVAKEDPIRLNRLAHKLKGSSQSVGATALEEKCQHLQEYLGSTGFSQESASKICLDVSTVFSDSLRRLKSYTN